MAYNTGTKAKITCSTQFCDTQWLWKFSCCCSTEMSSDDCFELGRQSYVNHDYYHTVLWMKEAMSRMREEPNNRTQSFTKADVLEYLAFSTYKQGKNSGTLLIYIIISLYSCV